MKRDKWTKKCLSVCIAAGLLMLSVTGCSGGASTSENTGAGQKSASGQPKTGGTITVGYPAEPDSLDIHKSTGSNAVDEISGMMGAALLYMDPVTHELKPDLAESYNISPDGKTWTFTIRSGVTFHDGTPFTAKSYKETFDRIFDPKTGAKNTLSFLEGIKAVSAPDDKTLILELDEPFAPLLGYLAIPGWLQPQSIQAIEKYGADYGRNPVGVGPWKFVSWQTGQDITFARNDQFNWGQPFFENQGPPHADKLVFKFIQNAQTKMAALDSGSIDVAVNVTAKDAKRYKNSDKFDVMEEMISGIGLFVEMNMKNEIFQDVQVRKALNMAINKEAIIQSALQGEGVVANGPLPPSMFGYDEEVEKIGYKYDAEKAKQLLESAGWKLNGEGIREKNGKTLTLNLLSRERQAKESQLVQAMLGELGIKVNITQLEPAAMLDAATKGDFDLTVMSYTHFDPDILYMFFHSSQIGGFNFGSVADDKLDELVVKARTTMDLQERKKIYGEAQKLMIEQAYIIPIYIDKLFTVVNKRVKGVKLNVGRLLFNDSWVDQ